MLATLALAGCATYHPAPLDLKPPLKDSTAELSHPPGLDPAGPLGVGEVVTLAVENDPDLVANRDQLGVANAQAMAAGILPNPSFSGDYGVLLAGPGTIASWTAGLSEDIRALITLSADTATAKFAARQVDATVLWQEWQVIAKARLDYVDIVQNEKIRDSLVKTRDLLRDRYRHSLEALQAGATDIATVAPDLSALSDIEKSLDDTERTLLSQQHDLHALLGLQPDAPLRLSGKIELPVIDAAQAIHDLAELPSHRPDLVALELGYRSQESKLRSAILAQFPAMTLGPTYASDTSHVVTVGPSLTMDLPLFNRNQGNVAIESATRRQLRDEFESRLAAAAGEVRASLTEYALAERQLAEARGEVSETSHFAGQADTAFKAGALSEQGYVDLATAQLAKEQEVLTLQQTLLEQRVALATILGAGMPTMNLPSLYRDATS